MDSRNLVISIVTCDAPEAYGQAELPFFTRVRGTYIANHEIRSEFEFLDFCGPFSYSEIDWHALYSIWLTGDRGMPALADIDLNPISCPYCGARYALQPQHIPFVVWSLHA